MNICLFTEEELARPLPGGDARAQHILRVLHKGAGDVFDAGVVGGRAGSARITAVGADGSVSFSFEPRTDGKPLYPLTLIVGFPRPIQLRRLLRDVAGLGVGKIVLAGTELGEKSYLKSNVVTDGSAERMLLDGTAQAASTHVPALSVAPSLPAALAALGLGTAEQSRGIMEARVGDAGHITDGGASAGGAGGDSPGATAFVALDNRRATESLGAWLGRTSPRCVVAAIGSERGWTEHERDLLEGAGFALCSMGCRVLRTETAATVASALILEKFGVLN